MIISNININSTASIDPSSTLNNVSIGDGVKIAKNCSIFGSPDNILRIGKDTYVGMNTCLNGYNGLLSIGTNVSIAQNVVVMTDSGPNASKEMQKYFPIQVGPVTIGDHSWIGASVIIMPNVTLGSFCVVAANSFVTESFPDYSVIAGCPAKIVRILENL